MTKEECARSGCDLTCENLEGKCFKGGTGQKVALPVNASIASEVARTGQKVNLRNLPLGVEDDE